MRLSTIVLIVTLALLLAPLAAAQPPAKVPRTGYPGDTPGSFSEAFRQSLRDLGYVEGEHLAIEYRWAEGKGARLPEVAAQLVRLPVDVLGTPGAPASLAAQ
jgi:putative tryptophan/tyrosine transport system substrate-binding protein